MKPRHAAVTIVSRNYLAYASVLAESYLKFHPGHDFVVALVDKAQGEAPARLDSGAEVIEIANFAIPDLGRFLYRYTIMEANTAVKPFVLADLMERRGYDTIVYLDPDILVLRPLEAIHSALERASIVLTPHMRRPYEDDALPSDLTILQSGTYNLGFIGLRRGESARRLLAWWQSKLYRDCVVDIPKGLFVDQKWIDLVPGFFPDTAIVSDPGCNAAYWNLHERPLTRTESEWRVDGVPLSFFHFSGYVPFVPARLSKHQNRHDLRHLPQVRALTDAYAQALFAHGYERWNRVPYAFATLSNGVRLPMELVRHAMQWAAREGVPTPCPVSEPDKFCRWLMSRNVIPGRPRVAVLYHFLLAHRGDVTQAYPQAANDSSEPGFREWVRASGMHEYALGDLLAYEDEDAIGDPVADAFQRLRAAGRDDVFARFADCWTDPEAFEAFAQWFASHGARQMRFDARHTQALLQAVPAVTRILNLYFLRDDLQEAYPAPGENGFAEWLRANRYGLGLEPAEISLFQEFALGSRALVEQMRLLYAHRGSRTKESVALRSLEARMREVSAAIDLPAAARLLASGLPVDPSDQFTCASELEADERDGRGLSGLEARAAFEFIRDAREGIAARDRWRRRINVAGYFTAASGMGESARSLRSELAHARAAVAETMLPHPLAQSTRLPASPALFGWPVAGADVSITVANADAVAQAQAFLPAHFRGKRNVGYWVWETESLPMKFGEAAERLDEIWSPSRHSADAISSAIAKPVRVLRHSIDAAGLASAKPDRNRFGLPSEGTLFGFVFDPSSVLERKNVSGLVQAFNAAFRADDNCWLVLKVNGRPLPNYDYESLRAHAANERILFVEGTLDRDDSWAFMRSLDAYASLHRAEGFGLTCAEAMGLGLPVVATNYSGNLEFMDAQNSLLVPARVIETDRPYGPYPAGSRWADPDCEAAAAMMRSLLDRGRREALGGVARASVAKRLDPRALGAELDLLLDALDPR